MPTPTRSCGAIVQGQPARGRKASAARPPPTRTMPAAIQASRPERGARRAARSAASGITVTTSPAAAGDMPQPSTSRRTSRKSAATSPPESRSTAAFAFRAGRPAALRAVSICSPRRATRGRSASGTCTRKIDSQPSTSVRIPPRAGPSAAPKMPAATHSRTARPLAPSVNARSPSAAVTSNAAPTACAMRAPTRTSKDGASPQAREAAAKTRVPVAKTARGALRATKAAGSATRASVRLKDVSTQATVAMSTSNSRSTSGSASVTIEESASASPTARPIRPDRMRRV